MDVRVPAPSSGRLSVSIQGNMEINPGSVVLWPGGRGHPCGVCQERKHFTLPCGKSACNW